MFPIDKTLLQVLTGPQTSSAVRLPPRLWGSTQLRKSNFIAAEGSDFLKYSSTLLWNLKKTLFSESIVTLGPRSTGVPKSSFSGLKRKKKMPRPLHSSIRKRGSSQQMMIRGARSKLHKWGGFSSCHKASLKKQLGGKSLTCSCHQKVIPAAATKRSSLQLPQKGKWCQVKSSCDKDAEWRVQEEGWIWVEGAFITTHVEVQGSALQILKSGMCFSMATGMASPLPGWVNAGG